MAALDFPSSPSLNQVYTANGKSYLWNGTSWIGVTSGMPNTVSPSPVASENLSAGDLVNIYNNGGTVNVRKANAAILGKEAHGYVLTAVTASSAANIYFFGVNNSLQGLAIGPQYLSNITGGNVTSTVPAGSGNVVQQVGVAISATNLLFNPGPVIVLG